MTTNEGPLRWKFWERFKLSERILNGRQVWFDGEYVSLRFLFSFVLFLPFEIALMSLDDHIQSKKFSKGYNLQKQGIYDFKWSDL